MDRPDLRFAIGTKVQCRTGAGDDEEAWSNGVVVKHWYREAHWPNGRVAPYQVKLDGGPRIFAPIDDDLIIREPNGLLKHGKIPVTCLTGFLGAGKTTLLNYILKVQHGKKYAIIENEVGAVGIDNQLLKAGDAKRTEESVTLLDNGCLCCTVRGDLVKAITDIVNAAKAKDKDAVEGDGKALDGILIETTGLADPGPICKTFYGDAFVSTYCRIDGVITVVDGVNFVKQLTRERTKDAVNESAQQVAFADKVLLNKADVASAEQLQAATEAIRSINPYVEICRCSLGSSPDAVPLEEMLRTGGFDLKKLLDSGDIDLSVCAPATGTEDQSNGGHGDVHGGGHGDVHGDSHGDVHGGHGDGHGGGHGGGHGESHGGGHGHGHGHGHSVAFRHDLDVGSMVCEVIGKAIDFSKFRDWMSELLQSSENLYRYKGILAVRTHPGSPVMRRVVQGVHDMCQSEVAGEWPQGDVLKSQFVLIGRKLDRQGWAERFRNCAESAHAKSEVPQVEMDRPDARQLEHAELVSEDFASHPAKKSPCCCVSM